MATLEAASTRTSTPASPPDVQRHKGPWHAHHGRLGNPSWLAPQIKTHSDEQARPGYNSKKAKEFLDEPDVLRAKVALVADLVRQSRNTVVYAGAGLSTSAGIGDYASRAIKDKSLAFGGSGGGGAGGSAGKKKPAVGFNAKPSTGHKAIAALARQGLVTRFVQQNHDGLPQKAGMPQRLMNEIHGAWFDPSNPVVPMDGSLRDDLFEDLLRCEDRADLVLTVGSSLCGMNADRIVDTCNKRRPQDLAAEQLQWCSKDGREGTLGSVIVSLQRTPHDKDCSVRIFALIDDVMALLLEELGLDADAVSREEWQTPAVPREFNPEPDVFLLPFDSRGKLHASPDAPCSRLDLRQGSELVLTGGPGKGKLVQCLGRTASGHYRLRCPTKDRKTGKATTIVRLLGGWWLPEGAARQVSSFPLVMPDVWVCGARGG